MFGSLDDFDALPPTHREQICFLDKTAQKYIFKFIDNAGLLTGGGWDPFAKGNFKVVEEYQGCYRGEECQHSLRKWLYRRELPFSNEVFLLSSAEDSLLTTWKMVVKYSHLFLGFSDTMVFDRTLNWCLFYYHESQMFFGRDNTYDVSPHEKEMEALNEKKRLYPRFRHPYM